MRSSDRNDEPNAQDKNSCRVNEIRELVMSADRRSPSKRWCILEWVLKELEGKKEKKDHGTRPAKQALPASWEKRKKTLS